MQARTCFAKGCRTRVQASRLMCLKHWRMVPAEIQDRVWKHYRKGQTLATISKEYGQAVRDARRAVALLEGVADPEAAAEVQTIRTALERRGYKLLAIERYDDGTMRVRVTHVTFGPYSSPTSVDVCRCWRALLSNLGPMPEVKS